MRIALIGTGRMGSAVTRLAGDRGHELSALFCSTQTTSSASAHSAMQQAEVAIDFSTAGAVMDNVATAVRAGVPIVVGTTGWHDDLELVNGVVREGSGAILHAPNFSLGVALLSHTVRSVTPLLNRLDEFDFYLQETHHRHKLDSPSGTALHLARILLAGVDRKTGLQTKISEASPDPDLLQVSSTRAGSAYGIHEVHIDSADDHITLSHEAKSRDGFAHGALVAAEWIVGRKGVFTLDDMLHDLLASGEPTL